MITRRRPVHSELFRISSPQKQALHFHQQNRAHNHRGGYGCSAHFISFPNISFNLNLPWIGPQTLSTNS